MCTDNGVLLSHKKNEIMPFAATMDVPRDYHGKWSKSEKDKYPTVLLIWRI